MALTARRPTKETAKAKPAKAANARKQEAPPADEPQTKRLAVDLPIEMFKDLKAKAAIEDKGSIKKIVLRALEAELYR